MSNALERTLVKQCMVCGSSTQKPFLREDDFDLVRCGRCGHVYVKNYPSGAAIAEFYQGDRSYRYTLAKMQQAAAAAPSYSRVVGDTDEALDFARHEAHRTAFIQRWCPQGPFLEIGCSEGRILKLLQDRGMDVYGTELNREIATIAKSRIGAERVSLAPIEEEPRSGFFAAIGLFNVFEHFPDPRPLLVHLHRLSRPGGHLLLLMPNLDFLLFQRALRRPCTFFPQAHPHTYSVRSLSRLLHSRGFTKVTSVWWGYLPIAGLRRSLLSHGSNAVRRALFAVSRGKLNVSDELMVIASKAAASPQVHPEPEP